MGFPSTNVPFFNANHRRIPFLATDHHPPFAIRGSQLERTSLLLRDIVPAREDRSREGKGERSFKSKFMYVRYPSIRFLVFSSSSSVFVRIQLYLLFVNRHECADRDTLTSDHRSLVNVLSSWINIVPEAREIHLASPSMSNEIRGNSR